MAAGCLILGLLLSGCAAGATGWSPELAAVQTGIAPLATPDGTWTDAGAVTVTPAAPAGSDQAQALPPADGTTVPAATGESGEALQFAGTVENLPATGDWSGNWQVAGRLVHVAATTTIDQRQGQVAPGAHVAIEGWLRPDSSVDAGWITVLGPETTVTPAAPQGTVTPAPTAAAGGGRQATGPGSETGNGSGRPTAEDEEAQQAEAGTDESSTALRVGHPVEFRGTVQQMPGSGLAGTWRVGGRTVQVNSHTRVQVQLGALGPGAYVQIHGWLQPDGSVNAAWMQVKKAPPANGNAKAGGNGKGDKDKGNNGNGNGGKGNDGKGKGGGNGNGD